MNYGFNHDGYYLKQTKLSNDYFDANMLKNIPAVCSTYSFLGCKQKMSFKNFLKACPKLEQRRFKKK